LEQTSSSSSSSSNTQDLIAAAQPLLQPLLDAASPPSFGRGRDTVYDPAYRTALELPASHVALNIPHPPAEVLQQIQALLQPDAGAVAADFYKLNIYGPGGFFKPHYDTPRSSDMFGTLVVCLPSPHSGGGLVLRQQNSSGESSDSLTQEFDWSLDSQATPAASASAGGKAVAANSNQEALGAMQWAAFYSDSEHEVLPVTDGYRITLTYNLRAVGHSSSGRGSQGPSSVVHLYYGSNAEPLLAAQAAQDTAATPAAAAAAAAAVDEPSNKTDSGSSKGVAGGSAVEDSWMTSADVASSRRLVDTVQALLANKDWHPEGDTMSNDHLELSISLYILYILLAI
jgi:hypothetical protein